MEALALRESKSVITVDRDEIDKLIKVSDGEAMLLYMYIVRNDFETTISDAAAALHRPLREIHWAMETLVSYGLLTSTADEDTLISIAEAESTRMRAAKSDKPRGKQPHEPQQPQEAHEEAKPEKAKLGEKKPEFAEKQSFDDLVQGVEKALGRSVSSDAKKKLNTMMSEIGMQADAIVKLAGYCRQDYWRVNGDSKEMPFSYMYINLPAWNENKVRTLADAEAWIESAKGKRDIGMQIMDAIRQPTSDLTPTQKKYIDTWVDQGFDADSIALALDKTVTNTGKMNWKYMNAILVSWHKQGLHTTEAIKKWDKQKDRQKADERAGDSVKSQEKRDTSQADAKALAQIRRLREKMNQQATT